MDIPSYRKEEVDYAGAKEGNYSYEDFNGFLYDLLTSNSVPDSALAIAQRAYESGTKGLHPEELHLLQEGIKDYAMVYCDSCRSVITVKRNTASFYLYGVHKH